MFAAWADKFGYDSWLRLLDLELKDVFELDLTANQLKAVLKTLAEEQPGTWGGYLSSELTAQQARSLKSIFKLLKDEDDNCAEEEACGASAAAPGSAALQAPDDSSAPTECVVCMEGERTATLVHPDGQGHRCVCAACADELFKARSPCPMCRKRIQSVLKTTWS